MHGHERLELHDAGHPLRLGASAGHHVERPAGRGKPIGQGEQRPHRPVVQVTAPSSGRPPAPPGPRAPRPPANPGPPPVRPERARPGGRSGGSRPQPGARPGDPANPADPGTVVTATTAPPPGPRPARPLDRSPPARACGSLPHPGDDPPSRGNSRRAVGPAARAGTDVTDSCQERFDDDPVPNADAHAAMISVERLRLRPGTARSVVPSDCPFRSPRGGARGA